MMEWLHCTTPLYMVTGIFNFKKVLKQTNYKNSSNWKLGHLEVTKYLIGEGVEVEAANNNGSTALHSSSYSGNWRYWYLKNAAEDEIQNMKKLIEFKLKYAYTMC